MKNLRIYDSDVLLEKLNVNKVPNISKVIRNSGIKVSSVPSLAIDGRRAIAAISGEKTENIIYINRHLTKESRRFIATYMYSYIQLYYQQGFFFPSLCEEENFDKKAYQYALKLLMPEKIFTSDVQQGMDIERLSKKYKVSMYVVDERKKLMNRDKQKAKFKVIQGGKRG